MRPLSLPFYFNPRGWLSLSRPTMQRRKPGPAHRVAIRSNSTPYGLEYLSPWSLCHRLRLSLGRVELWQLRSAPALR